MSIRKLLRFVPSILIALALGLVGLSLLFSDLGPGETITVRLYTAEALYFVSGLIIGFINSDMWWLAGITAWGGTFLGIAGLLGGGEEIWLAPVFIIALLLPAFFGGYIGALTNKKRYLQRLFHRGP